MPWESGMMILAIFIPTHTSEHFGFKNPPIKEHFGFKYPPIKELFQFPNPHFKENVQKMAHSEEFCGQ